MTVKCLIKSQYFAYTAHSVKYSSYVLIVTDNDMKAGHNKLIAYLIL